MCAKSPPGHRYGDYRSLQGNPFVLSIFGTQLRIRLRHLVSAVMNLCGTIDANPPQLRPIVGIVFDKHTHLRVALYVRQSSQPVGGLLL